MVEDEEDDYVLAREKLQVSFGAEVRLDWVSTWDEGLAAVDDASHDVYLVDFRLGARTGLELIRAASENGCSKPIILLTGQDSPDIDREALEAGAADYLIKGQFTADQLARSIRYAISQKSAEEALRLNEERFRGVVNNSPTKIQIKDAEGRYILVNDEAAKLFAVTEDEILGKTTHEIFPDALADEFGKHDQAVLDTGRAVAQEERWLLDGDEYIYLTTKFPIKDSFGKNVAVGAIGTDITERKRAEDSLLASEHALQQRVADLEAARRKLEIQSDSLTRLAEDLLIARDEAKAADRAKSEFLAAMSHELRTPLNAVLGFSEVIKDETFGPVGSVQYRDYAEDIHNSGKHLLGLINDILDLSKIESGTDELHEDSIEVPEIIHSSLKLVGQRAEQDGIKLELEIQDPLPALRADERKLKQILVNLLSNAIKFSDTGGEVALWAWCRMGSGHVFQIIDTGIGIAPDDIPKALSRFGQVDADLNRQYEGTGLGLPLTKALVELHGGTLDLQSQVGIGTTVTVRFPAERIVGSPHNAKAIYAADRKAG